MDPARNTETDPDRDIDEPLRREPEPGQLPSDTDVQAERQEEGERAERRHE